MSHPACEGRVCFYTYKTYRTFKTYINLQKSKQLPTKLVSNSIRNFFVPNHISATFATSPISDETN